MNEFAELSRSLDALFRSGRAEIREDGEWQPDLMSPRFEVRDGHNPLIHLWSDQRNLTRRIVRIREQSPQRVVLDVQRFGRRRPGKLEVIRRDLQRPAGRVTRAQFGALLRRFLTERFPDATIDTLTSAADLASSLSGKFVRGVMHEGSRAWAFLAAAPAENAATIDEMVAFGLLWLDWARNHAATRAIEQLWLLLPEGKSRTVCQRAAALAPHAHVVVWEYSFEQGTIRKIDGEDVGNIESRLVPRREADAAIASARAALDRIPSLSSKFAEAGDRVIATYIGPNEVAFLFRGLPFAHWSGGGLQLGLDLFPGRGGGVRAASPPSPSSPVGLLDELDLRRNPFASQTNHPLYRLALEKWLEAVIREEPTKLDAQLDPRFLYSQVPALSAGDRGVLDLLGVTRQGRLVVIEIKATESIQLPLQAADYWLRVRRHQQGGDFERCGYFPGIVLQPDPPLAWLVAPALRFHSAIETLIGYLSPEIQVTRIGVNENWRRGIRVMLRQSGASRSERVAVWMPR
jgi:hypothetical protein